MSRPAISAAVWGIYLMLAGSGFLLIPNTLLPLIGLPTTTEVWVRVLGLLAAILGGFFFYCARGNVVPFFRVSVAGRLAFAIGIAALVALGFSGPSLLIFAAADLAGGIWTWLALRTTT